MNAAVEPTNKLAAVSHPVVSRSSPRVAAISRPAALALLSPDLVAAHDPYGVQTEALRELRSQLILRWFGECRTLAVIGARAADDAETLAANLAIVMAQLGEETLLVDANLREPRVHELFSLRPAVGLSDLLKNRDVHDQALLPVPAVANLHVLCVGAKPANPQELVSRTSFMYLMKILPEKFRAVIVATPPALQYADAQIIGARAQGCLLVTRRHRTRIAEIERIKGQLVPGKAVLVGGVIRE
jgi:chain length determinant protein tyrosine kinase EpsG